MTIFIAGIIRGERPSGQIGRAAVLEPTRTQFVARGLAPVCSRSSTQVSNSQGR
ncbi:MAG: hypothetical protein OXI15_14695 [Chromatiales bacterium]|nr:hypothetical protein [Chromatiales bacterium]